MMWFASFQTHIFDSLFSEGIKDLGYYFASRHKSLGLQTQTKIQPHASAKIPYTSAEVPHTYAEV